MGQDTPFSLCLAFSPPKMELTFTVYLAILGGNAKQRPKDRRQRGQAAVSSACNISKHQTTGTKRSWISATPNSKDNRTTHILVAKGPQPAARLRRGTLSSSRTDKQIQQPDAWRDFKSVNPRKKAKFQKDPHLKSAFYRKALVFILNQMAFDNQNQTKTQGHFAVKYGFKTEGFIWTILARNLNVFLRINYFPWKHSFQCRKLCHAKMFGLLTMNPVYEQATYSQCRG